MFAPFYVKKKKKVNTNRDNFLTLKTKALARHFKQYHV